MPSVPAYVASANVGRWGIVPASNLLNDLNPKFNAALNPSYPSDPPWGAGHHAITDAWCSMATDPVGRLWCWGGGHADYGGNEPYMLDLRAATPAWTMMRPPSGSLLAPATDVAIDGSAEGIAASATGFFSDGRPRPPHTYGALLYVPGTGMVVGNLLYCWPHVNGPRKAVRYNETAADWALLNDYSALGDSTHFGMGTCYDPTRQCVWALSGGTYNMLKIPISGATATRHGTVDGWAEAPVTLRYDTELDVIYILSSGYFASGLKRVLVFDPVTNTIHTPSSVTGSGPAGYGQHYGNGAAWDQQGGRFLLWDGSATNRAHIATLTRPAGDPRTDAWTLGSLSIDGGNAVTPPAALTNGTFNRFDYVAALGICALVNATTDAVHFFKVREVTS